MIRKSISLLALLSISASSVSARVSTTIPAVLAEGKILTLQGSSFNSDSLALAASFKTVDGTTTTLDTTVVSSGQLKVKIPTVSSDTKGVLRISGGNVTAAKPQEYLVIILDEPTAAFITPINGDDLIAIPSTVTPSTQAATATTVTGASQANITGLAAVTTIGALGKTTVFPGAISVASGITGSISTAAQPSISTLTGLTSIGAAGITTQLLGPVQATQGFIGNITGNVTGTVTGNVTATTVIATTFNGTAESAVAGVTDIATAKEISDTDTVTISSATLIKVTDADNDDDLALIAGGRTGQYLTIVFDDAIVVIDDDVATASNAIDVFDDNNNNSESFASGDVLVLVYDGTSWHEVSRSMNATE